MILSLLHKKATTSRGKNIQISYVLTSFNEFKFHVRLVNLILVLVSAVTLEKCWLQLEMCNDLLVDANMAHCQ